MALTISRERPESRPAPGWRPGRGASALRRRRRRHRLVVLAFVSPWIVGFSLFFVYPLIATVWFSLTRYDLVSQPEFVGLRNYEFFLFDDPNSWKAVGNTLWFVAFMLPARVVSALVVAMLVIRIKRGGNLLRTVFFLPALVPPVAATLAFSFVFNPATGPVNQFLGFLGIEGPLWLSDPDWSKPTLLLLGVWGMGQIMVIFIAALLDVPVEQYEAASIDGANAPQRFWYVTLPHLSPVLLFAAITGVIETLQYFTEAVVASNIAAGLANAGGGIGQSLGYPEYSTLTYPIWMYFMGFKNFYLGYASAMAVILFLIAMAFTVVLLRRSRAFVHGGEGTR